jgi:phosphoglucosamine mutase
MADGGLKLAGEQSGHLIVGDHSTTGDGLLSALLVCQEVGVRQSSVTELVKQVVVQPQLLVNVAVPTGATYGDLVKFPTELAAAEASLGESGRVLVRPSGTEPKIRIMVEAADVGTAREVADRLSDKLAAELHTIAAAR